MGIRQQLNGRARSHQPPYDVYQYQKAMRKQEEVRTRDSVGGVLFPVPLRTYVSDCIVVHWSPCESEDVTHSQVSC